MEIQIPNKVIRAVLAELKYQTEPNSNNIKDVGYAIYCANNRSGFGAAMTIDAFKKIIEHDIIQKNDSNEDLLKSKYQWSEKGEQIIFESGKLEEEFGNEITNRHFIFSNSGELAFGDIYELRENQWRLLDFIIDLDLQTQTYFNLNKNLIYQFWKEDDMIFLASNFKGFKRMMKIPCNLIKKFNIRIEQPAKGNGKFEMTIDDLHYRGVILGGDTNEYNKEDFKARIWRIEHEILPKLLELFNGEITSKQVGYNC